MNYGYGPQEMDTAQDLVVRAGRRADPPIHDAYGHRLDEFVWQQNRTVPFDQFVHLWAD